MRQSPMPTGMADGWLHALVELEHTGVAYNADAPEGQPGIAVLEGRLPVLISAPHAARHWRSAAWKREDEYTAAFAHWLHQQTGAFAIYTTHRIMPDPHADDDRGHYKQLIKTLLDRHPIRLVLDLHGARGDRDFALALGTIHGQTCQLYEADLVEIFRDAGFTTDSVAPSLDRLALNPGRYAGGTHTPTVTRFAWQTCGVPAVQIEVNAWARIVDRLPTAYEAENHNAPHFRGDPARIRRVLDALVRIIEQAGG